MLTKDKTNLLGILEAVEKIEKYSSSFHNPDELFQNTVNFDAVLMNFILIGEMVARLSSQLRERNNHIEWVKIKGLRNIIAHDYFGVDAEEVWQIITTHLPKLKSELLQVLEETE